MAHPASEQSARETRESLLLERDAEGLEQELERQYSQLGKEIYEAADRRIGAINALVDRLVDTKRRLCGLRGEQVCPSCLAHNPEENGYCGRCGSPLAQ